MELLELPLNEGQSVADSGWGARVDWGGMHYLVTGAAGFIGSQIAEGLISHATSVIGVDCFTRYYPREIKERNLGTLRDAPNFRLVEADLRCDDLTDLLTGVDVVLHQAGQPGVRLSWGDAFGEYVGHNVMATQRLLEASLRARVQRFVFASSSSVYGNAAAYPTTESALPRPFSPYGTTKLAAEHLCGLYAANWGLPTVALRYFTVYGARQRPDMALHRFIRAAIEDRELELYGNGEQLRDFTHVDDVVRANVLAATRPVAPGTTVNIAGGAYETVNGVLATIAELTGRPLRILRKGEQAGDVAQTRADCSAAEALLGWQPTVPLAAGIASQLAWQLDCTPGGDHRFPNLRRAAGCRVAPAAVL
jgi:UDP-glucuronate 4-epimerase